MIYLFLGSTVVGLWILLGMPLTEEFSSGQYAFLLVFSMFLNFLPTLGYVAGRYISKSQKLHWSTLLFLGFIVGLITQMFLPNLGLGNSEGPSTGYIMAFLFFVIAFLPPKIEFWRSKQA